MLLHAWGHMVGTQPLSWVGVSPFKNGSWILHSLRVKYKKKWIPVLWHFYTAAKTCYTETLSIANHFRILNEPQNVTWHEIAKLISKKILQIIQYSELGFIALTESYENFCAFWRLLCFQIFSKRVWRGFTGSWENKSGKDRIIERAITIYTFF